MFACSQVPKQHVDDLIFKTKNLSLLLEVVTDLLRRLFVLFSHIFSRTAYI